MTATIVYPLIRVLEVKKKRVENAEKVVREKELALKKEEEKLEAAKRERDKVSSHLRDKINQLRQEMDQGTTSPKIIQMKVYIKEVKERLEMENKKVEKQKEEVQVAEKNLELAKEDLKMKRRDLDKLEKHREEWEKRAKKEFELLHQRQMDEMGSVSYLIRQKEMRRL